MLYRSSEAGFTAKRDHSVQQAYIQVPVEHIEDVKDQGKDLCADLNDPDLNAGPVGSETSYALRAGIGCQNSWYFDSGASDHVSGDYSAFDKLEAISPIHITIGDESQVVVTHKGSVTLTLDSGKEIGLSEVLYSKGFGTTCLISVPQLTKKGATVIFEGNRVFMIDSGQTIASGTLCKNAGLYRLDQQTNQKRVYRAVVSYSGNSIQD